MAKGKRITIRLKAGLGVLSPERDDDDNLKHLDDREEGHDVPASFGFALVQEGRATMLDSHGLTPEKIMEDVEEEPTRGKGRAR